MTAALTQQQSKGVKMTLVLTVGFSLLMLIGFFWKFTQPRVLSTSELRANNAFVFETARIPRPFQLLDESGVRADNTVFEGKWTLAFFGFVNCPDICPSAMAQMRDMKAMLEHQGRAENVQFMLVSVDPDRDSADILGPYVRFFDEEFRGLTGEYLQVKQLAGDFNVAFNKVYADDNTYYSVDHSGNIALINPYGHYQGFFKPPFQPTQLVLTFNSIRQSWRG